ncbi:sirohydrochlorin chelatase [Corynebacterium lubricantis]|uniref:sirohydrochlorin chelatase n=1 Tax=Corynebacterium lubricantis TaxID=541095 RepID=UPI000363BC61|nr:sirohydrochlorin chelatase [Corynebacterium lubricantis]
MTALITLSHGSRHPEAEVGVRAITRAAARSLDVEAVESHLDFSTPTLSQAAAILAAQGHDEAVVVPLLFTDAYHAKVDVPAALAEAAEESGMDLYLAETLGQGKDMAEILARRVSLDAPQEATIVLYPVGTSDEAAAQGTESLAADLAELSGHDVFVVPATGKGEGRGLEGLRAIAANTSRMHVLPLFVTHGTLLDAVVDKFSTVQDETGVVLTHSAPLLQDLVPIVAQRYRELAGSLVGAEKTA